MKALVLLLILMGSGSVAEATPHVQPTATRPCSAGVEFVRTHSADFPDDWTITVFCNSAEYQQTEKLWRTHSQENGGGFTSLEARRTYVLFDLSSGSKLSKRTAAILEHELKHIRCWCDLGEGH